MNGSIVEFVIEDGSPPVLYGVLDGCDSQDDNEGNGIETRIGRAKDWEDLD
jgi:hypothetical protein